MLGRFPNPDAPPRPHQRGCLFGPGYYRVHYWDRGEPCVRYFDEQAEVDTFLMLIPPSAQPRVEQDACIDQFRERPSDANTDDVMDGAWWLSLPRLEAMEEAGLASEEDYRRVYAEVEALIYARDNRASQGGVRPPVVIRRHRTRENAELFVGGSVHRIR